MESVELLKNYLRIKSVHPNPDYNSCIELLIKEAESSALKWQKYELVPGKPILILTWPGTEPGKNPLLGL
jgi:aminoacylase